MKRTTIILGALFLATALFALEVPPPPTRWVTDRAGVLSESEVATLDAKLQAFEQRSGHQFIVYILPSLEGDSLERFTIEAAERWKAGPAKYDDGLILFVFPQDRQVRIEVGYGLEGSVTDAMASRVIRQILVPAFQQNRYAEGIDAASDRLIEIIEKGEQAVPLPATGQPQGQLRIPFWVFFLVPFFVIFVLGPMSRGRGRRRSGCSGCLWLPFFFPMGGTTWGGHRGGFSGGGFGGGGFGGFSGGGGGFGGGGASGSW